VSDYQLGLKMMGAVKLNWRVRFNYKERYLLFDLLEVLN